MTVGMKRSRREHYHVEHRLLKIDRRASGPLKQGFYLNPSSHLSLVLNTSLSPKTFVFKIKFLADKGSKALATGKRGGNVREQIHLSFKLV